MVGFTLPFRFRPFVGIQGKALWRQWCIGGNLYLMKTQYYLPILLAGTALALCSCASDEDTRPVPGTVQSTDSKTSENNTPQTNPNPNPEPASNPPGPQSDEHPVGVAPQ
jgi:hypothetical protein